MGREIPFASRQQQGRAWRGGEGSPSPATRLPSRLLYPCYPRFDVSRKPRPRRARGVG